MFFIPSYSGKVVLFNKCLEMTILGTRQLITFNCVHAHVASKMVDAAAFQ